MTSFSLADRGDEMKRVLVIGAGLIGRRHIATVQAHPGCALAGVVDPDTNRRTAPDVLRFRDLGDVDVPVDGVIIASPTGLHAKHGQAAAIRGWHMLIEKPVTETEAQAEALSEVLRRTGVQALAGHHRRYHASVQLLRYTIARGRIGTPVTSTLIWSVRKPNTYFQDSWRSTGGSPVIINLIHDIDLLRFVLGEITNVAGFASQAQRGAGRIESGAVALQFASGACGTISFADTAPAPWGFEAGTAENPNIGATWQDMWWITGTEGALSFPSLTLWTGAEDWSQAPQATHLAVPETVPLKAQLDHFLAVIEGSEQPIIDIADARLSLKIAHRIEMSLSKQLQQPELSSMSTE